MIFSRSLIKVSYNNQAFENYGADLDFDKFLVAQIACQALLVKQQQK